MYGNYTQAANDRCYNVLDQDIYDIWDAVESLSDDESAECWKEKCEKLAYEYSFSSRFALMRILYSRVQGCTLSEAESDDGFSLEIAGEEYFLSAVNMEHAEEMDEKEIKQYENILNEMAKMRPDADVDPNVSKYLIAKALKDASEATELAIADLSDDVTAIEKRKIKKKVKLYYQGRKP